MLAPTINIRAENNDVLFCFWINEFHFLIKIVLCTEHIITVFYTDNEL